MKKNFKRVKYKGLVSFILLFISVCLFAGATYAWFTDTATVKGNKVFAGNLYVDVIADFNTLQSVGYGSGQDEGDLVEDNGKVTIEGIETPIEKYVRNLSDNSTQNFYKLTDVEAPFIAIYNVEPGQAYSAKFGVLNSGDLAVKYTAGFQISTVEETVDGVTVKRPRSYTGLETLEFQHSDNSEDAFGVYHNKYQNTNTITNERIEGEYNLNEHLDNDEYTRRKTKLEAMQRDKTTGEDLGGHLEDVLEVYAVTDRADDGQVLHSNVEKTMVVDGEVKKANYIGTVKQMINLFDPTFIPTDEERGIYEEVENNMNRLSTGYLLPVEIIKNPTDNKINKDGITVNIYGSKEDPSLTDLLGVRNNVSEIGECEYIIYMPEDADNKYQNASLFLDMGVTGSQVDFEFDGLNYMIYDMAFDPEEPSSNEPITVTFHFPYPTFDRTFTHTFENNKFSYVSNATIDTGLKEGTIPLQSFKMTVAGLALGYNESMPPSIGTIYLTLENTASQIVNFYGFASKIDDNVLVNDLASVGVNKSDLVSKINTILSGVEGYEPIDNNCENDALKAAANKAFYKCLAGDQPQSDNDPVEGTNEDPYINDWVKIFVGGDSILANMNSDITDSNKDIYLYPYLEFNPTMFD